MNIHKLNEKTSGESSPLSVGLSLQQDMYDLAETILTTRAVRSLDGNSMRYPIHREVRCAAKRKMAPIFDDLATQTGLSAMRMEEGRLYLDGPSVFVEARGWPKIDYCSCHFHIWADSVARAHDVKEKLLNAVGEYLDRGKMFTIDWHFLNGRSGLASASFDELANDPIHDESYPSLGCPVTEFVDRYLSASETVLVLQGPPGTGKTRLVRAILAGMSARKGDTAKVMYTADKNALEKDQLFVDFITGSHDAFVIEDADHMLKARSSGNYDLHRFLAIADGVVRAQGRKIIFTTNLPNITDIDDALLRPGRCFASICTRMLSKDEAIALSLRLSSNPLQSQDKIDQHFRNGNKSISVAAVYQSMLSV
jgi:hypothetical protein